jgi:hypothetical protein
MHARTRSGRRNRDGFARLKNSLKNNALLITLAAPLPRTSSSVPGFARYAAESKRWQSLARPASRASHDVRVD